MSLFRVVLAGVSWLCMLGPLGAAEPASKGYKVGVASTVITPTQPQWMAGYGARNKPSEGKVHDLYLKVIALEDAAGNRLVLLTSDLVGIPRQLGEEVAAAVQAKTGLPRERLMLTCSHTHCGPMLAGSLVDMFELSPEMKERAESYTTKLRTQMVEAVSSALRDLKPARLALGQGKASFALNRRQQTEKGVIIGSNPSGPVDHSVPVLRVETPEGKLRAVVFGYACHNTTLDFYQWCGDYAGFAQEYLQERHPGALALFWIGCGGDANPMPRRTLELCQKHGKELADAVDLVIAGSLKQVQGTFSARYEQIAIPFDKLPSKETLSADMLSKVPAVRRRAARLLKLLESNGAIDDHYRHYPVQTWRLGASLLWVALGVRWSSIMICV